MALDVTATQNGAFVPNGGNATESPAGTFNLNNAIPLTTLFCTGHVPVRPGQRVKMRVTAALPGGATATTVRMVIGYRNAAGGLVAGLTDPIAVALGASQTWEFDGGTVPAGTAVARLYLSNVNTGNGLAVTVSSLALISTGAAEELLAATLERPYRRAALDLLNTVAPQFAAGVPGLLAGQLTDLCRTYGDAIALDAVYCNPEAAAVVAPPTEINPLDGLRHRAVGAGRLVAERALPGKASKWLLTVDIREVA